MRSILLIENSDKDFYISRLRFAQFLIQNNFKVTALVPSGEFSEKISKEGINVISVNYDFRGKNIKNKIKFSLKLFKIIRVYKFEIIHCFRFEPNIIGGFVGGLLGCKVFNHITGLGISFSNNKLKYIIPKYTIKFLYKFNHVIFKPVLIFQNKYDPIDLEIEKNYFIVRGSAVNENKFFPRHNSDDKKYNFFKFLFASRLIKNKGLHFLIDAIENIHKQSEYKIELTIAGWSDDLNPESYSEKDLRNFKQKQFTKFLGRRDDIAELINESDVCILPTLYREGTPRFLLEAMACAKPIITTNMPGCDHLVNNNGYLIENLNSSSVKDSILKIIKSDLKELGSNSLSLYTKEFSEKIVYNQILELYNKKIIHD